MSTFGALLWLLFSPREEEVHEGWKGKIPRGRAVKVIGGYFQGDIGTVLGFHDWAEGPHYGIDLSGGYVAVAEKDLEVLS